MPKDLIQNIAIIQGGASSEKAISYQTSLSLQKAMKNLGYSYCLLEADDNLSQNLIKQKITKAILAVHGQYAEDGTLQGLLEYLKIPYTGSGVLASAVCMDKVIFKKIITSLNITTPKYCCITKKSLDKAQDFLKQQGLPLVVKPSRGGSSLGTFIIKKESEYLTAITEALKEDSQVLIEECIEGAEITIPFFDNNFLTPIEISTKTGFYDYKNKYTKGCTHYKLLKKPNQDTINSPLSKKEPSSPLAKGQESVKQIIQFLDIRHYGRADFILDKNQQMHLLEINTLPGFTESSLITKSGKHDKLSLKAMMQFLIDNATLDY
ncbi:MAG: D-alanine--D-alanine ligase [Bdellovibrionaceae bacterium]|nr:D-alanine--D-alanine ligase [Pseudobdellovibrionaceae bacterium]